MNFALVEHQYWLSHSNPYIAVKQIIAPTKAKQRVGLCKVLHFFF